MDPHNEAANVFASVGDDRLMVVWDIRCADPIVHRVADVHTQDVHAVDWNPFQPHLLLTGSADNTVQLIDTRRLGSDHAARSSGVRCSQCRRPPVLYCLALTQACGGQQSAPFVVKRFEGHSAAVMAVSWCPNDGHYFVSCSDDGTSIIWNTCLDVRACLWRASDAVVAITWLLCLPGLRVRCTSVAQECWCWKWCWRWKWCWCECSGG